MTPLGFFGRALCLLVPCFALWHYLAHFIAAPGTWLTAKILMLWLPDYISSLSFENGVVTVITTYGDMNGELVPSARAGGAVGFRMNTRTLSYSIPFFTALHFAVRLPSAVDSYLRGLAILSLLLACGLIAVSLKDLMLTLGSTFLAAPSVPPANVIALAYQLSTLIVPPLAPILVWALEARHSPAVQALFPALFPGKKEASEAEEDDDHRPPPPVGRSPLER